MRIGAHVDSTNPLTEAALRNADVVQLFLGNPQSWDKPAARPDAAAIRAAGIDIFIHAPYVINVATPNNRVRIPSRNLLTAQAAAAAGLGARGIVVHGGHVPKGHDIATGIDNWRKAFERAAGNGGFATPVLIENTAGGDHACARRFDVLARLWDAVGEYGAGFCLDTCHAFCGGEELPGIVDRVRAITGRIDLVHANNAKDSFDSRRDRHDNLTAGTIDPDLIVDVVRRAGAPVIVETPGGAAGQTADIAYLRQRLE
ncbi:MAG: deoxyribonuclease IV [Dactylosporangium sp.]|nr:deoxyribonuclease IV [Dactylosporangium sp.]NNJ61087.1 deoxyribonuclease IV [Dactylosporangium sp.]